MKVESKYIADDGKTFLDRDECLAYEKELEKKKFDDGVIVGTKVITKRDVHEFFNVQRCDSCLFKKECDKMYQFTRAKSTDTLELCDVILRSENIDPYGD